MTIHRLLEFEPHEGGFQRDRDEPARRRHARRRRGLDGRRPAVPRACSPRCRPGAQLVLVGDVDQLPSVGAGAVLADVIASERGDGDPADRDLPPGRREQDRRHRARDQRRRAARARRARRRHQPTSTSSRATIPRPRARRSSSSSPSASRSGSASTRSPTSRCSRRCTAASSAPRRSTSALQDRLNPAGAGSRRARARRARVPPRRQGDAAPQRLRPGRLQRRHRRDRRDRRRRRHRSASTSTAAPRRYERAELDQLVHAYAVSIHKSQGSEYPAVVIPLATQHFMMLQRSLLYTGGHPRQAARRARRQQARGRARGAQRRRQAPLHLARRARARRAGVSRRRHRAAAPPAASRSAIHNPNVTPSPR